MASFHNVKLSDCIEKGAQGGPNFNTAIQRLASGYESKTVEWERIRGSWDISYAIRNKADREEVLAFFYARQGRAFGFRFKDWSDYNIGDDPSDTPQEIDLGDGISTQFQIVRRYTSGSFTYDRIINKIVANTTRVFISGIEQSTPSDYTVDIDTGIIDFTVPPTASFSIGVICEFDVPVRFDTDQLNLNSERDDLYGAPGISIVEVRDQDSGEVPVVPIFTIANKRVFNSSVSAQTNTPQDVFFKSDGTRMYVTGGGSTSRFIQYTLSTPWLVTSKGSPIFSNIATWDTEPTGQYLRVDGLKMYMTGSDNNQVHEFDLTTAFLATSISFVQSITVAGQSSSRAIEFKPDGLRMFVIGNSPRDVYTYDLSTAWDISTASLTSTFDIQTIVPGGNSGTIGGLRFDPNNGQTMFLLASGGTKSGLTEYSLSTPWDVSTATFVQNYDVARDTAASGLSFSTVGDIVFFCGSSSDRVYQLNLA